MALSDKGDGIPRRWLRWGLFLGVWTVLGAFETAHSGFRKVSKGEPVNWGQSLVFHLSLWYAWGLVWLVAYALARRLPFTRGNWWHRLPLVLAVGVLLALGKIALDYPLVEAFYCPEPGLAPFASFYRMGFTSQFHRYVLIALGMLGIVYAWTHFQEQQRRERESWQLEARLAQAELELLRAQLHPHFLFNALHAVGHLVRRDPDAAERVLARLGDLLRHVLDTTGERATTLRQELEFLRAYLDIEQTRFGPRLSVHLDVEPGVLEAPVPPLILQPLVENSVRHGVARSERPARIEVRAGRAGGRLRLEVWDDGPGLANGGAPAGRKHLGLANTLARLEQLFGSDYRFDIRDEPTGVLATLELPLSAGTNGTSLSA